MNGKKTSLSGMQNVYDSLRKEDDSCQAALKAAQDRLQAISIGQFSTEDGESATLQESDF